MVLLINCCCCIGLRTGCIIIACIYILTGLAKILGYKDTFDHLGPEENEDEENKKQKSRVLYVFIIRTILEAVYILVSAAVIIGVFQKVPCILKIAGCFIVGMVVVLFVYRTISSTHEVNHPVGGIAGAVINTVVQIYFGVVWYSYGQYIEEEWEYGSTVSWISVHSPVHSAQYPPPYKVSKAQWSQHPYFMQEQQRANTFPGTHRPQITTSPYPAQDGQRPYFMQGPQSSHSLPGTQRPQTPTLPYPTQDGQSPQFMQEPQSSQPLPETERPETPTASNPKKSLPFWSRINH